MLTQIPEADPVDINGKKSYAALMSLFFVLVARFR
jgi:hypothetical protein